MISSALRVEDVRGAESYGWECGPFRGRSFRFCRPDGLLVSGRFGGVEIELASRHCLNAGDLSPMEACAAPENRIKRRQRDRVFPQGRLRSGAIIIASTVM